MSEATNELRLHALEDDVENMKHVLFGVDGKMGMTQMVAVIWKTHVIWPACTLSAIGGAILTIVVALIVNYFKHA